MPLHLALCFTLVMIGLTSSHASSTDRQSNQQCRLYLRNIFLAGTRPERAIGFHGTSEEALREMIQSGYLPTSPRAVDRTKSIYFFPNLSHPQIQRLINEKKFTPDDGTLGDSLIKTLQSPTKEALEGARFYAKTIAQRHRLLRELQLPIDGKNDYAALLYLSGHPGDQTQAEKHFSKFSRSPSQVEAAASIARRARGIILFIGEDALQKYPIRSPTMPGDDGARFQTNKGLPFRIFIGAEPMGDSEFHFLDRLEDLE